MTVATPLSPAESDSEIAALVETLRLTERRLEELTGGHVDSLIDSEGRTIVLQRAQNELRRSEAAKQTALLDSLPAHVALLDADGVIVSVNEAWRRFARENALQGPENGIGVNYIRVCERAQGTHANEAREVAAGIRAVLAGTAKNFSIEYPCHSPLEQRWYLLTVSPIGDDRSKGAVLMHVNVTARTQATAALKKLSQQIERREKLLNMTFSSISDFAYALDRQGRFLFANKPLLDMWGTTLEEAVGKTFLEVGYTADAAADLQRDLETVLATKGKVSGEIAHLNLAGHKSLYEYVFSPALAADGTVDFVVGCSRDFTARRQADDQVRTSQRHLRNLIDGLGPSMFVGLLTPEGILIEVNESPLAAVGLERADVLGRPFAETHWWSHSPHAQQQLREAIVRAAHGDASHYEVQTRGVGDETMDIDFSLQPLRDENGKVAFLIPSAIVITERKRTETLLRNSEAEFRTLAESVPQIVWVTTSDGRALYLNQHWIDYTGLTLEESLGQGWNVPFHPEEQRRAWVARRQAVATVSSYSFEARMRRADGEYRWWLVQGVPQPDATGNVSKWFGTCTDIHDLKLAELERSRSNRDLQRQRTELRVLFDLVPAMIWFKDTENNILRVNQRVADLAGLSVAQIEGKPSVEIYPQEAAAFYAADLEVMRSEKPKRIVETVQDGKGNELWVQTDKVPYRDDNGKVIGIVVMAQDITERKNDQDALRALNERLTNTLESITDGFFTVDRNWRITYVNGQAERMWDRPRDQLVGSVLWEALPGIVGTEFEHGYRRAMADDVPVKVEATVPPDSSWFLANAYPSEEGLTVSFRDTTVDRAARHQLLLLDASVSQLNDIVVITEAAPLDAPGPRILFVNDAFERSTGYSREDALGNSPRLLQGPLTSRVELDRIRVALSRFEHVHAELVNYNKAGQPYWIEIDIVPFGVEGEGYTHFVEVGRDITQRKVDQDALRELNNDLEVRVSSRTAELNLARNEADHANHAKSAFLASMSHEIRTPMNGVIGMMDVLNQTSLQDHQVEMVDLVRDSAYSLLGIIDNILDFSKIEAGKLEVDIGPVQLRHVVEKVSGMLDHLAIKSDVGLMVFVDPAIPSTILGDETRLRQVLLNLTGNAIKFSGGGGQRGEVSVRVLLAARESHFVTVDLIVADNGIGMDAETIGRLFTPFSQADVSTTRRYGGTGLGLVISQMLVRLMEGTIAVESAPEQGSTFTVRLRFAIPDVQGEEGHTEQLVTGLRCRIVGTDAELAGDLSAYLTPAGAVVERSLSLEAAAAEPNRTGKSLWIILPGADVPPIAELRAMAATPGGETAFLVLGRGKRRRTRVEAPDLLTIDADVLSRRTLFHALAVASGRANEDVPIAETDAASDAEVAPLRRDAQQQGRLILVAEDNETNRKVIMHQLQLIGFAAEVAVNGRDALVRWRSGDFSLLLTDLHMPEMDGYQLTAAIRAEEKDGSRAPIIALTANALRDEQKRCLDAGMNAYLTKPVRLPELKAVIEEWLAPALPAAASPTGNIAIRAAAAPVDLAVLRLLIGDDEGVISEVLKSFRESAERSSAEIKQGSSDRSMHAVVDAAHRLKSGARAIGALRLGEICADIEQKAPSLDAEALGTLLGGFDTELGAVYAHLDSR
jgi:PAS domain S-box-containing protein